jgi:hypothetical protein
MQNKILRKGLLVGIIILFFGTVITPTLGISNSNDDNTPPITTHTLEPATPDGDNGWYVSDVEVRLIATDDMSGVKEIKYKISSGSTQTISGDIGTFVVDLDAENLAIEYWAIDNVGNEESHHTFSIDIDQTEPLIDCYYEWEYIDKENGTYLFIFNVTATDVTSKMNRVEFIVDNDIYETIYGPGPKYTFQLLVDFDFSVNGYICKTNITEEYVKFYAIVLRVFSILNDFNSSLYPIAYDNAGNEAYDIITKLLPVPLEKKFFKWYKFPNNYKGYIGKYYIDAIFEKSPMKVSTVPNILNFEPDNLFLQFIEYFPLLHSLLDILRWS